MYIHVERITARVNGKRTESVACEKCGTGFYYELTRTGVGQGSAVYGMFKGAAQRRAEAGAQKNLQARLLREAELVPCPKCKWVNQELVGKARRGRYRQVPLVIVLVIVIGLATGLVTWGIMSDNREYGPGMSTNVAIATAAFCVVSPVLILLIRRQLRLRVDPNRGYPNSPPPPPGTPPALIEFSDPQTGQTYLQAAPGVTAQQYQSGDWAILRPGQLLFPRTCCLCLEPSETAYKMPFKVNKESEVEVPLCKGCSSRLRGKWWLTTLLITATVLAAAYTLATVNLLHGIDEFGRWILAGTFALFGVIFSVAAIPHLICRPYRMKVVDKDRGIIQFKSANPEFTQLLIDRARAMDGVAEM